MTQYKTWEEYIAEYNAKYAGKVKAQVDIEDALPEKEYTQIEIQHQLLSAAEKAIPKPEKYLTIPKDLFFKTEKKSG